MAEAKKKIVLSDEEGFYKILQDVCRDSRFCESKKYIQHGNISVYMHSIAVAYYSCWLAEHYNIKVKKKELIRGALLHDYFLYDWHKNKEEGRHLHGFTHPATALRNALEDFDLTLIEQDIIKRHMFPLIPVPPKYREGVLVSIADKICSIYETTHRKLNWSFYLLKWS